MISSLHRSILRSRLLSPLNTSNSEHHFHLYLTQQLAGYYYIPQTTWIWLSRSLFDWKHGPIARLNGGISHGNAYPLGLQELHLWEKAKHINAKSKVRISYHCNIQKSCYTLMPLRMMQISQWKSYTWLYKSFQSTSMILQQSTISIWRKFQKDINTL